MRAITTLGLVLLTTVIAFSQDLLVEQEMNVDPATQTKIDAKTKELAAANGRLEVANLALQDRFAALEADWEGARTGRDSAPRQDVARAFADAFEAARKAGAGRRAKRAFGRIAAKAAERLEHRLLTLIRTKVQRAAAVAIEGAEKELPELADEDLAVRTLDELTRDATFHGVWNEVIAATMDEIAPYAAARRDVMQLESEIQTLRDPKHAHTLGAPAGMARIPAGTYFVESLHGYKSKRRRHRLKPFYIDLHEVTHGEYWSKFYVNLEDEVEREKYLPRYKNKKGVETPVWDLDADTGVYVPDRSIMDLPVVGIDLGSAMAYAKSQGKRLPTEAEWVAAASGSAEKLTAYPWGEKYVEAMANDRAAGIEGPVAVRTVKRGRSFFGLYHVAGNVDEFTATTVAGKDFEDEIPKTDDYLLVATRGGSFLSDAKGVSCQARGQIPALHARKANTGFRCAMTVPIKER